MQDVILTWIKEIGSLVFSWPTVILIAVIIFNKPLKGILKQFSDKNVTKAKVGPIEIEREFIRYIEDENLSKKAEEIADNKIIELQKKTLSDIENIVNNYLNNQSIDKNNLKNIVEENINTSRVIDKKAEQEAVKLYIINYLYNRSGASFTLSAGTLIDYLQLKLKRITVSEIIDLLIELKNEEYIYWEGELDSTSVIYLQKKDK